MSNAEDLTATALALHDIGCCVLPAARDGTKRPALSWAHFRDDPPSREQTRSWFSRGIHVGLGVICGAASNNLEMLELEGRAVADGAPGELTAIADASGLGDLWRRVTSGYLEATPGGGLHILYRVDGTVAGNTKLACRPSTPDELAAWKTQQQETIDAETDPAKRERRQQALDRVTRGEQVPQVLAETRGEGGWVVLAPSSGPTHETGRAWVLLAGGADTIATVTPDERDALHRLAALLDRMPRPDPPPAAAAHPFTQPGRPFAGVSPGDDYTARTTWEQLLEPHGWTRLHTRGDETYWRRPGKTIGISATTGYGDGDYLWVFTTSTEFEAERAYDRFGAYAALEHGGDFDKAARALSAGGYGQPPPLSPSDPPSTPPAGPRTLHSVNGTAARVIAEPAPDPTAYGPSEDGLARVLAHAHEHELRYCPQRGKWLAWDGHRWAWDDAETHRERIRQLARTLPDTKGDWRTIKRRALSAAGVTGVARHAQSDPALVIHISRLDADPYALNTPTGIIDLRTGALTPADPAKLHTRSTLCTPDYTAASPLWTQFLATTFGGDQALIDYLRRLVGYSTTGAVTRHLLPFAHGSGGNGKGVFLEALTKVLGDYATTSPARFLMAQAHSQHETEIARLAGARMVLCSEINEEDRFDEARVKQLTGGDSLTARFMRQDHFTFTPSHKLWLMGNNKPAVRSGGPAFWRRLRLIPFEHQVPDEQRIDDLQGILARDHGPALLAWIVTGARDFVAAGLAEPDSVKAATSAYEADQDSVGRFVEECCRLGGGEHVKTKISRVRDEYEKWCITEGEIPVSAKAFGQTLARRFGIESSRDMKTRFYIGLVLTVDDASPADASSNGAGDDRDRWFR